MGGIRGLAGYGAAISGAAVGLALVVGGLLGADALSAQWELAGVETLSRAVAWLDLGAGKGISNFLLGTGLILVALAWNGLKRRRLWTGRLFYVGAVQLTTTALADFAKPPFGRLRPFQAGARGEWADGWFMGPDYGSFPSGHVAFYAGLCLPLALIFPRWAAALLAVPVLVGAERVLSHDHYVSDVGASFLIAAAVAAGLWKLLNGETR
jgi:membrane-associated phospholipid phosphatase